MKIEVTYAYVNLHFGSIKEMYNLKFMTRARSTESQRLKISTKKQIWKQKFLTAIILV